VTLIWFKNTLPKVKTQSKQNKTKQKTKQNKQINNITKNADRPSSFIGNTISSYLSIVG
jgi:hypothetical protein